MTRKTPSHVDQLRGASRLAVEATRRVTEIVEAMHLEIASGPAVLGRPLEGLHRAFTSPVYATIRGVTTLVGAGLDAALGRLTPLLGEGEGVPGPERDAVVAALNGVLGDYLHDSGNALAVQMRLRQGGKALDLEREALSRALPRAGGRLLVLVHGSSMSDRQWRRGNGFDLGESLASELGATRVNLHYNSGLHISTNGRAFAVLLEELTGAWPVPVTELTLVCHSMGGLVARSACRAGEVAGHAWRGRLGHLVCLGTPHHGAPLERAGNWIDVLLPIHPISAPLARLGKLRSAGVTDMRFGNVLDEHWDGHDRFAWRRDVRTPVPLPAEVACFAVAGTVTSLPDAAPRSDGLVPVDSALGRHPRPELTLRFPEEHQHVARGVTHLGLIDSPEVAERVRSWLALSLAAAARGGAR